MLAVGCGLTRSNSGLVCRKGIFRVPRLSGYAFSPALVSWFLREKKTLQPNVPGLKLNVPGLKLNMPGLKLNMPGLKPNAAALKPPKPKTLACGPS